MHPAAPQLLDLHVGVIRQPLPARPAQLGLEPPFSRSVLRDRRGLLGALGHPRPELDRATVGRGFDEYQDFNTAEEHLLDCPQYTRPADFRGWKAPEVLLSGNHEEIRKWRRWAALEKTSKNRPDLLQ